MACVAQASIDETSDDEFRRDATTLGATNAIRDSSDDPETGTTFIRNRCKVFVGRPASTLAAKARSYDDVASSLLAGGLGRLGQICAPDSSEACTVRSRSSAHICALRLAKAVYSQRDAYAKLANARATMIDKEFFKAGHPPTLI